MRLHSKLLPRRREQKSELFQSQTVILPNPPPLPALLASHTKLYPKGEHEVFFVHQSQISKCANSWAHSAISANFLCVPCRQSQTREKKNIYLLSQICQSDNHKYTNFPPLDENDETHFFKFGLFSPFIAKPPKIQPQPVVWPNFFYIRIVQI